MLTIWDNEQNELRRQVILMRLRSAERPMHMFELANDIDEGESKLVKEKFHNSHIRRVLTADIDAINRDMEVRSIIKSDNRGVRLCTKEECESMYAAEYREAVKKLDKCRRIAKKAGLDGQITLDNRETSTLVDKE